MTRFQTLWMTLALCGLTLQASAQITYGGSPWTEGARPAAVTMPAIDRAALAAEDAVTDRHKEAPWRFGVEHEMALNPVEHGRGRWSKATAWLWPSLPRVQRACL